MALDLFRAVVKTEGQALSHVFERIKNGATVEIESKFLQVRRHPAFSVLVNYRPFTRAMHVLRQTLQYLKLNGCLCSIEN